MCSGFEASTTMFGSLFGNGSSQSSFVFRPPEVAVHSNDQLCLAPGCGSAHERRLLAALALAARWLRSNARGEEQAHAGPRPRAAA